MAMVINVGDRHRTAADGSRFLELPPRRILLSAPFRRCRSTPRGFSACQDSGLDFRPGRSLAVVITVSDTANMSTSVLDDDLAVFDVVVNHEEQYSIWPADREPPAGWRKEGTSGKKAECLRRIEALWTDMRPLSARVRM